MSPPEIMPFLPLNDDTVLPGAVLPFPLLAADHPSADRDFAG